MALSASELAQWQTDAAAYVCDQTCVCQHKAATVDGLGTSTFIYTTYATVLAGLAEPTAGQLANYDYEIGDLATWTVHVPVGTNVLVQDHFLIGGQTLEVHILLTPKSYPALESVIAAVIK